MLFNSVDFAVFLPIVFLLYWTVASRHVWLQNLFVAVVSYVFYGWWDVRFLSLIAISTLVDYGVGLGLGATNAPGRRKVLLWTSLVTNLGILGFFKYCNFFADSLVSSFSFLGVELSIHSLNIVLPVGISFYTLQTLSYTIDVYRGKLEPTRDLLAFAAFVSFFPQLVAGPIERAGHLLPQFLTSRQFDCAKAFDGLRQILWGLFKKVVIADNCAICAGEAFSGYEEYNSLSLLLGAFCFSLQIYCDFSGYSDIAIGTARLFGMSLKRNFAFPYFSRDIAEFWRRWHISLSTWFRDYVYFPMGGSKCSTARMIRNTFIVFIVSGLWHGANWTFVVWGFLNALYFLPLQILGINRRFVETEGSSPALLPTFREVFQIGTTFGLTVLAWVFFRAESLTHAFAFLGRIFAFDMVSKSIYVPSGLFAIIAGFLITEWVQRGRQHPLELPAKPLPLPARWATYYAVLLLILIFGGEQQDFIYFQF
ncbi:MAG TPA: MBOAT family protein [Planctomycetes bacterium]|nr:MBOAT family protein [Fuerstiella sp.]HIK95043.1 MBOAT family protein [Planctomycetota bacterium]